MDKFNLGAIGAIETAQTNLGYTSVVAPSDGRMGVRLIDPGNIVSASDSSPIVTLTLTKPAAVLFTLSARSLNDVRDAMAGGPVEVIAFRQDNRADPILGKIVGRCDAYTSANEIRWDPLCNRGRPRARGEAPGARSDSARLDPEVQRHRWTAPRCSGTPVNSAFEGIFSFPTDRPRPGRGRVIPTYREHQWPPGHTEAEKASTPPTASFRPFGPDMVMKTAQGVHHG